MNKTKKAWKRFIENDYIDTSIVRPIIADSWKRCKLAGVDPYSKRPIGTLNNKEIKALIERNRHLIEVSWPILKMIGEMIRGSGFRVDLVDKDGYFLKIISDMEILEESKKLGSVVGANRSELAAGTNGIAIALFTGNSIQILGSEHYNIHHHNWTCSAAPIYDPSGNIIGAVNMSGNYRLLHKHTLGMVVGISNAIESALKTEKKVLELSINNKFLNTIIESISDGLIVINKTGEITHLNSIAGKILCKDPHEAIGKPIDKLIRTNFSLLNILNNRKGYLEEEIIVTPFYDKKNSQRYLLTEKVVEDSEGESQGVTALFKEMKKVHRLIGSFIGANTRYNFSSIIGNNVKLTKAVELAEGGTLFLDEIGSMPLEAQPKLLRILESNQLIRIGGNKIITTDIRIISATNQNLLSAAKKGNFREDLFYRINTVTVDVPPLRERKDDIPILAKYICDKIGRKINKNNIEIDKKVLEVLCEYDWPGNIRELENALESAIILSKNNKIIIDIIPENIKPFKSNDLQIKEDKEAISLADIEKEEIFKVLKEFKGNITKASRELGIDRSTLYRKIEKYKISK